MWVSLFPPPQELGPTRRVQCSRWKGGASLPCYTTVAPHDQIGQNNGKSTRFSNFDRILGPCEVHWRHQTSSWLYSLVWTNKSDTLRNYGVASDSHQVSLGIPIMHTPQKNRFSWAKQGLQGSSGSAIALLSTSGRVLGSCRTAWAYSHSCSNQLHVQILHSETNQKLQNPHIEIISIWTGVCWSCLATFIGTRKVFSGCNMKRNEFILTVDILKKRKKSGPVRTLAFLF